jgi:hypothetical protein
MLYRRHCTTLYLVFCAVNHAPAAARGVQVSSIQLLLEMMLYWQQNTRGIQVTATGVSTWIPEVLLCTQVAEPQAPENDVQVL